MQCKSCTNGLSKQEEEIEQCLDCLHKEEKENFECDFDDDEGLTCIYQYNMFRQGNVMDCDGNWLNEDEAKNYPRPEELQNFVDWIHIHNSGGCVKYFKHVEPKEYKETCEHFGVPQ